MRVRAVELEFGAEGELVVIGGRNAQGKSSVLAALEMALAGAGALPAKPIRKGAESGDVRLVLRDREGHGYDVALSLRQGGGRSLVVRDLEGATVRSPQALLDGFLSAIAFDPLEFARLAASRRAEDKRRAAEILRELVGLDLSDVEAEIAAARDARLEAGRALDRAKAQLAGAPPRHADAPAAEESVAELVQRLVATQAEETRREEIVEASNRARAAALDATDAVTAAEAAVVAAQRALDDARDALVRREAESAAATAAAAAAFVIMSEAPLDVAQAEVAAAREALATVDGRNEKVRANQAHAARAAEVKAAQRAHDDAERAIEKAEETKRARLGAAEWPIDGLAFDDAGLVRLNDLPFEQASTAEQVRTSLAIGMALNPQLRLIVSREGSMLDDDALRAVAEMAAERDVKVLLERVGQGDEVSVVIEDGEVAEDRRDATSEASE